MTVNPVVDDFVKIFGKETCPYKFQYKLARWQFEKFNYLASMTTLLEATITYACVVNNLHWQNKEERERCKKMLQSNDINKDFKVENSLTTIYRAINKKRNNLVHQTGQANSSADEYVKAIKDNLKAFGELIIGK